VLAVLFVAFLLLGLLALYVIQPAAEKNGFSLAWQIVVPTGIVVAGQVVVYLALSFLLGN
jgi:uncharacterized integral membrane protein